MAAITSQRLKQIIAAAFEAGYHNCLDEKDSYADEIISALLAAPEESLLTKNDGWKVWPVKELRSVSVGLMFEHTSRGRGWIESNSMERYMRWHDGTTTKFYSDESPWNEPMRPLGMTMKHDRTTAPKKKPRRSSTFGGLLA
jgi:hypothetical protein